MLRVRQPIEPRWTVWHALTESTIYRIPFHRKWLLSVWSTNWDADIFRLYSRMMAGRIHTTDGQDFGGTAWRTWNTTPAW